MADERISVSRETLRAELAELELRLIEKLASREQLAALETRVAILEKTALVKGGPVDRQVQKNTEHLLSEAELRDLVNNELGKATGQTWTRRDRVVAVVLAAIAVTTFLIQVLHPFAAGGTP